MPIIKSAKKRLKQERKNRERNLPVISKLKTTVKKMHKLVKDGNKEEAEKFLSHAYKVVDMAAKRNLIHARNAARKKSGMAKALNDLVQGGGSSAKAESKPAPKKKVAAKKSAPKAEAKVDAKAEEKSE